MTVDTLTVQAQRGLVYGALALAAVLAVVAVFTDTPGRLLTIPAAVGALAVGLRDLRGGPLVVADADGLTVRDGWRRVSVPWSSVERMRVVKDRRAELLELDLGRSVVLLSRTRLGRLPADVLTELLAVRDRT